ncbi:hypothetical protein AB1K62_10060 [Parasphingorhabdus sp. JC815]|uniref:hypothetical protein n=1 Tax=Parasphingorhabdus sp. JC815 TaxID=3232140 RepID=UPI0034596C62
MHFAKKLSTITASVALVFTGFAPAMAATVNPAIAPVSANNTIDITSLGWSAENDKANRWRGYRGHRGYRGYRGYRYGRGYRRNRVDAGDVIAGILIIGGIAAIASAASKQDRNNDSDYRYDRSRNNRYRDDRRNDWRYNDRYDRRSDRGTGSMDTAINICSDAAEIQAGGDARVSEIESVARDGNGWRVEGALSGSTQRAFLCGASDGRVDFVQLGNGDLVFAN